MRLGNRGWGLLQMIIFLVMFFIFIMIVAVISYKLGIAGENNLKSICQLVNMYVN